jgi:hypothetical protein
MKKMLNEGNQVHNFISSSGSGTVINYGSGSGFTSQKVTVPTVPVPHATEAIEGKSRIGIRNPEVRIRGSGSE